MKEIRWGFIGCGKVVKTKSGAAFQNVPDSRILAVMGRDPKKAKNAAEMLGAPEWCCTVEELLEKEIDAVYIATPPGLHYEQAMACLKAKKPVYLEKPFARNYREAKELTEAFEKERVALYLAHYRRALPLFLKVRELLEEGIIGEVKTIDFRLKRVFSAKEAELGWLYNPEISGGGKFYDIAPHTIDMIQFLFGNIVTVESRVKNLGVGCPLENLVEMSFKTERGALGTAVFNCTAEEKADRMYVAGTKGTMEFSVHGKTDLLINDRNGNTIARYDLPDPEIVEEPMVKTVVEDLLGRGACESRARDVLVTYDILDRVLDEFYGGRSDDFWKYPERFT